MYSVIENAELIGQVTTKFYSNFSEIGKFVMVEFTYGKTKHHTRAGKTLGNLGICICYEKHKTKHWFAYGIYTEEMVKKDSLADSISGLSITVEINFPVSGINRNVGAVFAQEGSNILVLHRGKFGGGFTKKAFEDNFQGKWISVSDGERKDYLAYVCKIGSDNFMNEISDFVHEVARIKENLTKQ